MKVEEIISHLKSGAHILSKDYHDGCGRQYWLRDGKQNDIATVNKKQFREISKVYYLSEQQVISSDEAFWYELKGEAL
jgi:hypothetical protein